MGTLTNSEYHDEMPQHAAFHQGLHCLLGLKISSDKKSIKPDTPDIYTMNHPKLIVSNQKKKSVSIQTVDYEQIHNLPTGSHVGAVSLHWPELKHILLLV